MLTYLLAAACILGLSFLFYAVAHNHYQYRNDGKRYLEVLRDPSRWDTNNPVHILGDLAYALVSGDDFRGYGKAYTKAKRIGSTPEELWRIHRAAFRWRAERWVGMFRERKQLLRKSRLDEDLKEADCTLEDIGMSAEEFRNLQKEILFSCIGEAAQEYLQTNDPNCLFALRPDFEEADVALLHRSDIEGLDVFKTLDPQGQALVMFAGERMLIPDERGN